MLSKAFWIVHGTVAPLSSRPATLRARIAHVIGFGFERRAENIGAQQRATACGGRQFHHLGAPAQADAVHFTQERQRPVGSSRLCGHESADVLGAPPPKPKPALRHWRPIRGSYPSAFRQLANVGTRRLAHSEIALINEIWSPERYWRIP